ncbi:type-F conjugative transfer system protein TrbI [Escherichia coli]|nr:type-F conjugative transfer system protein TrbI [Escherichia coli]
MTTTQKTTDVTAPQRSHWWWTVPGCLAMVLLNAAVSYGIVRLNAPVTAAFNMKQTVDAFFDSASQKQLSEAQSKALSARFNTALEASLQAWQQKHHAVILVSPAVVQGAPDIRPRSRQWWQLFRMVSQWHVDVVIVERRSFSIVAAVELDDASHLRPERRRRDILLEEVLRQAGIPLLRSHDARKLLQMTGEWLNTTGAAQQSPEHRS